MLKEITAAGIQAVLSKPVQPLALEPVLHSYIFKTKYKKQSMSTDEILGPFEVIGWDACVQMCNGNLELARELISMRYDDLDNVKKILADAYINYDTTALCDQLHRSAAVSAH